MLNNLHPNKIFLITSKAPKYIFAIFIIVISVGLIEALILSPEDYIQSDSGHIYIRANVDDDEGDNIYIQPKSGENLGIIHFVSEL